LFKPFFLLLILFAHSSRRLVGYVSGIKTTKTRGGLDITDLSIQFSTGHETVCVYGWSEQAAELANLDAHFVYTMEELVIKPNPTPRRGTFGWKCHFTPRSRIRRQNLRMAFDLPQLDFDPPPAQHNWPRIEEPHEEEAAPPAAPVDVPFEEASLWMSGRKMPMPFIQQQHQQHQEEEAADGEMVDQALLEAFEACSWGKMGFSLIGMIF
jgi:hypothetical protein